MSLGTFPPWPSLSITVIQINSSAINMIMKVVMKVAKILIATYFGPIPPAVAAALVSSVNLQYLSNNSKLHPTLPSLPLVFPLPPISGVKCPLFLEMQRFPNVTDVKILSSWGEKQFCKIKHFLGKFAQCLLDFCERNILICQYLFSKNVIFGLICFKCKRLKHCIKHHSFPFLRCLTKKNI